MSILSNLVERPAYTLMRGLARFTWVRGLVAAMCAIAHKQRVGALLQQCEQRIAESPFRTLDRNRFVTDLSRQGVAEGLALPSETTAAITTWARQQLCFADRDTRFGFMADQRASAEARLGKPILVAQYFNAWRECAEIRQLASDPVLQWVAARYLQSPPVFVGANLWWTFPVKALQADRDRHAHLFHRDVDDFRFFKFFFYLTDVAPGEGAHVCVKGSHRRAPVLRTSDLIKIRRYTDEEIERAYPPDQVLELCGPAGTGFAENTLCMHKGSTPRTEARLLLQLQFALFDYGVTSDDRDPHVLRALG